MQESLEHSNLLTELTLAIVLNISLKKCLLTLIYLKLTSISQTLPVKQILLFYYCL